MSTHNNNHEPTSPVNYEQTTPNPYLHDAYLPPPPPEYYMHQRTGKAWRILIPFILLLFGLLLGILIYPAANALYHHTAAASPTPFVPFALPTSQVQGTTIPTTQTPAYIAGLSSGDPRKFVESFSKALLYRDTTNLSKHKADQFLEVCQSSKNPPPSETPACTNGWDDLAGQLSNGSIELIVDPTAQMTVQVTPADPAYGGTDTTGIITGQYVSTSNSNLPLSHTGTAQFWFLEGGSGTTAYTWDFVYLWPTV